MLLQCDANRHSVADFWLRVPGVDEPAGAALGDAVENTVHQLCTDTSTAT